MKKLLAILLSVLFAVSAFGICASAASSVDVFVTIADANGSLAVSRQSIAVTDIDSDGKLTINDTLYCAHQKFYTGGAAAGYGTELSQWGLSLKTLWGTTNGGSYGYYLNNTSAFSLRDTVKSGDYVCAFVYTDTENFSDAYSFFTPDTSNAKRYEFFTVTLCKLSYDTETWTLVSSPVAGAVITVDGKATPFVTDENGKATIAVGTEGTHVISATVSGSSPIVAPVCTLNAGAGNFFSGIVYNLRVIAVWLTNLFNRMF